MEVHDIARERCVRGGWWHMDQAVETTLNKGGQPVGGTHKEPSNDGCRPCDGSAA
eukprot:COSAG03_NODE_25913_length_262_cov_1.564417_1_plen_54_part_10